MLHEDFGRGLNLMHIQNPMSILNMALESRILTAAHECLQSTPAYESVGLASASRLQIRRTSRMMDWTLLGSAFQAF